MSVATISCHGNEALCERLGVDHGTYYFKDGVIDVKSGEVRVARHCTCAAASSSVSLSLSLFVVSISVNICKNFSTRVSCLRLTSCMYMYMFCIRSRPSEW